MPPSASRDRYPMPERGCSESAEVTCSDQAQRLAWLDPLGLNGCLQRPTPGDACSPRFFGGSKEPPSTRAKGVYGLFYP